MALYIKPSVVRSAYEYELFTSVHTIYQDALMLTSIACVLSSYTISCRGSTNVSVRITGSTLIVSGWYGDIFDQDILEYRDQRRTSSIVRIYDYTNLPNKYFKATTYLPDRRPTTSVSITIFTDKGTINTTQIIKNNWNLKRSRLHTFIRKGTLDSGDLFVDGTLQALPDQTGPFMYGVISTVGVAVTRLTITSSVANVVLQPSMISGYVTGNNTLIEVYVSANATVYSTVTSQAALTVSNFTTTDAIRIINNGTIIGKGGDGGSGPNLAQASAGGGGNPGGIGGDAIYITNGGLTIENNGLIGGGGGGGGSQGGPQYAGGVWYYTYGGAGGGGGAGFGMAGIKSPYSVAGVTDGTTGTATTGGVAGSGTSNGGGGNGGALGQNGFNGNANVVNVIPGGGSGGAAGNALRNNSSMAVIYWSRLGTVLGNIV